MAVFVIVFGERYMLDFVCACVLRLFVIFIFIALTCCNIDYDQY